MASRPTAPPVLASRWLRIAALAQLLLIVGGLWWIHLNNPTEVRWMPACPTRTTLHLQCPGCGSTRAAHHLANGRLLTALRFNPFLVVFGVPLALWYVSALLMMASRGRWMPFPITITPRLGWIVVVLLIAFFVLRNIDHEWTAILRSPGETH